MRELTLLSLFDGSGGFPLAASMCGIRPVACAEVEPYPIAVTKSRFPNMKHLGSVTDVHGGDIEPVDIITFGSPCQDLSVAGKRAGLKHKSNGDDETTRSGLFMEAVRIIKEMRKATNGEYPTFAVWENVPGAFSSNKGEDFRTVLEELIKIVEPSAVMPAVPKNGWPYADSYCGDGWSLAYRVFDAQYWGVPQRRRRIYLVLDLRGQRAGKVSFEREGLRGNFATFKTAGQGTAGDATNRTGADDCEGAIPINTMIATRHKQLGRGTGFGVGEAGDPQFTISAGHEHAVAYTLKICDENILDDQGGQQITVRTDGKAPTLRAETHGNLPCVLESAGFKAGQGAQARSIGWEDEKCVAYSFDSLASNSMKSKNPHSGCRRVEIAKTLDTTDPNPSKNQGGIAIVEPVPYTLKIRSGCDGGGKGALIQEDKSATLATNNDQYLFQPIAFAQNQRDEVCEPIPIHDKATRYKGGGPTRNGDGAGNGLGVGKSGDPCPTLSTCDHHMVCYCMATQQGGAEIMENLCPTITASAGMSGNNQPVVCEPAVAFKTYQKVSGPLMANSHPGSYTGQDAFSDMLVAGVDCRNLAEHPELYPTLQAKPNGGQSLNFSGAVRVQYIVRRLTPTECARLQGFPDAWGHPDHKEDFTDEEYRFWLDVRNTHAAINGKPQKDYTKDQMLTWYNKLHTDSSEYKMWGNGISLPTALYVMQGIAEALKGGEG